MATLPKCCSHFRNWKLMNRAIRLSSSRSDKPIQTDDPSLPKNQHDVDGVENDFFGFGGEGVVSVQDKEALQLAHLKAWHQQMISNTKLGDEMMHVTNYGNIRLDSQNAYSPPLRRNPDDSVKYDGAEDRPGKAGADRRSSKSPEMLEGRNGVPEEVRSEGARDSRRLRRRAAKSLANENIRSGEMATNSGPVKLERLELSVSYDAESSPARQTEARVTDNPVPEQLTLKNSTGEVQKAGYVMDKRNKAPTSTLVAADQRRTTVETSKFELKMLEMEPIVSTSVEASNWNEKMEATNVENNETDLLPNRERTEKPTFRSVLKPELELRTSLTANEQIQDSDNYVEDQYFREILDEEKNTSAASNDYRKSEDADDGLSYIDKQFFSAEQKTETVAQFREADARPRDDDALRPNDRYFAARRELGIGDNNAASEFGTYEENESLNDDEPRVFEGPEILPFGKKAEDVKPQDKEKAETNKFETAFDYIHQLRKEKAAKSPKLGAANEARASLKQQVKEAKSTTDDEALATLKRHPVDLESLPEYEVLAMLKKSIIWNDHGIVALNKPYGLLCQKGVPYRHYLQRYLPELAKTVKTDMLYPVHRLDRGTTGVLLLAKDAQMASKIKMHFKMHRIQKIYWAITRGVPSPAEGIINIPIAEGTVDGDRRMVLRPAPEELEEEDRQYFKSKSVHCTEAVTFYKIVKASEHAAFVHLKPTTGVKHQVRVHLGFGMSCPIIGDHKYTYFDSMKPQKLHFGLLNQLSIKQSKVRTLPIYLHARAIIIPEIADGQNVFIQANLSQHFKWALQRLKLSARRKEE